jgi:hypothetical protein
MAYFNSIHTSTMKKVQKVCELKLYSVGAWFKSVLKTWLLSQKFLVALPSLCFQILTFRRPPLDVIIDSVSFERRTIAK